MVNYKNHPYSPSSLATTHLLGFRCSGRVSIKKKRGLYNLEYLSVLRIDISNELSIVS